MLKIAIINHDFCGFSGSEIVTLEIANYFASRGGNVVIRAERFSDVFKPNLHERVSVSPHRIDISKFDIVWSQNGHFALNTESLRDLRVWKGIFIASHLSSSTPAEAYHYPFSAKYADGIIFNAERVQEELMSRAPANGFICNFRNAAPKKFHKPNVARSKSLENLLVVSNHLPEEVSSALSILKNSGIVCHHVGIGGMRKLIEPADIHAADAVMSIGKTVQYSLVGGCPVYCYDHFGGPGWLSVSNYELAEKRNFSGRCTAVKKSAEQIVEELLNGYAQAKKFTINKLPFFHERFDLEAILDAFMDQITTSGTENRFNSQDCIDHIDLMRGALLHVEWIWGDVYGREHLLHSQLIKRELEKIQEYQIKQGTAQELANLRVQELEKSNSELEKSRLEAIRVLSISWMVGLAFQPWRAKEWNKIRKMQRRYKNEAM